MVEQLDEALDAINRKEKILTNSIMEFEFEIQARMASKTKKANLNKSLNNLKLNLNKELNKNGELNREKYEAFLCTKAI